MKRNIVFVAPFPMATTMRFAEALGSLDDVRVLGIFQQAPHDASPFDDVVVTKNVMDAGGLVHAIERICAGRGKPDRILGILEQLQMSLARAREHFGVSGPDVQTAERFRDKALMKDEMRKHGLPCARHRRVVCDADAWGFVEKQGYPIILKPTAGAGSKATYRIDRTEALREALDELKPSLYRPVLAEEFLSGEEFSFETITVGGVARFHSISRYYPGPLEVMQNPHLQWVCLLPRDIDTDEFTAVQKVGMAAIRDLGLDSGMTHMEWFKRPDQSVAIGEIALRPPGAQIVKLMSLAYDCDMYRAWARATVDDAYDGPWERKYSVGVAFMRGPGSGRITRVDGVDEAHKIMGDLVVDVHLPQVGAHRSDSYEGDGYAIVRHSDTEVVKDALLQLIRTVKVHYER